MTGFTAQGLDAFRKGVHEIVERGVAPGVVALVGDAADAHVTVAGVADLATGEPLREDAIFRIQSMTKPIVAVATMQLVECGVIALDDPVDRWVPELADRVVLRTPASELDDVVPAKRSITVDDLLTCRSGYGMIVADQETPIARALVEREIDPGTSPRLIASDDWIARLVGLPLIHQPGEGWRYHTSFEILAILLSRSTGSSLGDYLQEHVFGPLGMTDTGLFVPASERGRLPAAYRRDPSGTLVEIEPAGGGYYAESPSFDVSHGELVSTARDYYRFASMLLQRGQLDGVRILTEASVSAMTVDHIEPAQKSPDAFFPGFWETDGWGYGMGVTIAPDAHGAAGRYHWMGGEGTAWFNDSNRGLIGIFLSQVLIDEQLMGAVHEFYRLANGTQG